MLVVAHVDGAMVDVLFRVNGVPVPRERFESVDTIEVESVQLAKPSRRSRRATTSP